MQKVVTGPDSLVRADQDIITGLVRLPFSSEVSFRVVVGARGRSAV